MNSSALRNFFYNNKFSHNLETINSILQKSLPIINFFFLSLSYASPFLVIIFPLNLPCPSDRAAHKFCKSERENVPKWKFNIETCGLCAVLTEAIFYDVVSIFPLHSLVPVCESFLLCAWTCSYFSSSSLLIKIY